MPPLLLSERKSVVVRGALGWVLLSVGCATSGRPLPAPAPPAAAARTGPAAPTAAPASLPAPAPAPVEAPRRPSDAEEALPHRLDFRYGEPAVSVRLMEGVSEVRFSPRGRMRLVLPGDVEKTVQAPAKSPWQVRLVRSQPALLRYEIQLAELPFVDKAGLLTEEQRWRERGEPVHVHVLGSTFGIAGKVIDNRRYELLLGPPRDEDAARAEEARLLRSYGVRTTLFPELMRPATGVLALVDDQGATVGEARDRLTAETLDRSGFDVRRVEFGVGYSFHGFEDRSYRGGLEVVVDDAGKLAVVNLISLENLLKGLVPSEIFARAHPEALKAQAVTARGEVLAKVGIRHLADPYLLCSEQHCAVYKGLSGEAASTNAAVEATRGEALFDGDGHLVDSVYSAVCGGHTESNENVWGGPPNPSLRGVPDLLEDDPKLPTPRDLEAFLSTPLPAACRLSSFAQPSKYRWERRFTAAQMDELTRDLKLGPVRAISVLERGVSGRATLVSIAGEQGATELRGELNIRRRFGMLNSSMFLVSLQADASGRPVSWLFKGGGWGHGVGMCQTGAIGRAEAGEAYRTILEHYFTGAHVARIY